LKHYYYRAKKSSKEVREGVIEASTEEEVIARVNDLGLVVVEVREKKKGDPTAASQSTAIEAAPIRCSTRGAYAVTRFYKQLARMLQSGLPLLQALTLMDDQVEYVPLRKIISAVRHHLSEGQSFSQALLNYPSYFPAFDIALMQAGEMVGHLDLTLKRIAAHREAQEKLNARIRGALTYPLFVLTAGIAAAFFMLCFVLPQFSVFFLNLGQELPLMTRGLIYASQVAEQGWPWIVFGAVLLFWIFKRSLQNNESRIGWHRFYLAFPRVGKLILYTQLSRFARTISLLLESGIPLLKALQAALPVITNQSLRHDLQQSVVALQEGGTLSESFVHLKVVPAFVTQLVRAGEASGRLQESLNDIADWYEQELQERIEIATKLLEPILILVVGAFLGFMVIAVLLPVFSMNAAIS